MRRRPSRLRRLLWHVGSFLWPNFGYVNWLADQHPLWSGPRRKIR